MTKGFRLPPRRRPAASLGVVVAIAVAIWVALATPVEAERPAPQRFGVTVTGAGPDVILIPGLASPGAVWEATAARLSATHRVHVMHLAGFAGRAAGANARGDIIEPMLAELAAYAMTLDRPVLAGHSMGGLMSLELAARHPDMVGGVLVVDALPFYPLVMNPEATVEMAAPQAAMVKSQLMAQSDAQYVAGAPMTAARLAKSEHARVKVAEWAAASDRTVVAQAVSEVMVRDARPRLADIKAPVTVIVAWDTSMGGGAERLDELYAGAYSGLEGVTLKRIDDGYHFIMLDQPDVFARETDAFLARIPAK